MNNYGDEYLNKRDEIILKRYPLLKFKENSGDNLSIKQLATLFFVSKTPTYFLDNTLQCISKRNRSIIDFYCLVKHYYPETKYKDIYRYVKKTDDDVKKKRAHLPKSWTQIFYTCPSVGRTVARGIVSYLNFEEYERTINNN